MRRVLGNGFLALAMLLSACGLLSFATGAAAADEGGIEDAPPSVVAGELSPTTLPHEGGNVQIRAEIVDDVGLQMVSASVFSSDGYVNVVQLYEGYEDNYFGTFEVPENPFNEWLAYSFEVQAYDTNNAFVSTYIGDVQIEPAPQFDEAPYVTSAELNPSFLPSEGGTVTISADAGDNRALAGLFATVALPGGDSVEVPMNPTSSSHFEGTYEVPANAGPLAAEYLVEVVAQDDIGQEGRGSAGTITVAPPPPPPSSGRLEIWPGDRSFGSVKLGKRSERTVFVRNLPRKGGEPVEATAVVYGSNAFSLSGSSTPVHFVLQPGEKRAFTIEFRPTAPGQQYGAFEVIRDDGTQSGLAVDLAGRGSR